MATFAATTRRAQLVDVTIDLLAEAGVEGSSYLRIAERAGVSPGVLHYHFGSRADLFSAVVDAVYALGADVVGEAVRDATSPGAALERFVRGSVHFYADHRRALAALTALYASRSADAVARADRAEHRAEMARIAELLRSGQEAGSMRDFDVELMAASVRGQLDLAAALVAAGTEPGPLADELTRTVRAMTAVGGGRR